MKKPNSLSLCLSTVLLVSLAFSSAAAETAKASRISTDAVLTKAIQNAFSDHFEFRNVTVSVQDREAILEGSVETIREKLRAEAIARTDPKILGLRDYLAVIPTVAEPDAELRTKLIDLLRYEGSEFGIQVNNLDVAVREGNVIVSGEVSRFPDKEWALAVIEQTPGVRNIRDEIRVQPYSEIDEDLEVQAAKAFYADPVLKKSATNPQNDIRVVVQGGVVRLYGLVRTTAERHLAEVRERQLPGVITVENYLIVEDPSEQALTEKCYPLPNPEASKD
ncbi:MAG: BON domain-containing protein [Terriglobia bacterium]|nr:BON domain-containing protein [Terriglobia bacterium]